LINVFPLTIEIESKYINTKDNIVVFNGNLLNEITLDILNGVHIKLFSSLAGIFNELPTIIVTKKFIQIPNTKIIPFKFTFNIESRRKKDIKNSGMNALINE
tara:strand:+ start:4887 stop:5192 length:306 start_codon:yes stop_codon:yes gene_type:complete